MCHAPCVMLARERPRAVAGAPGEAGSQFLQLGLIIMPGMRYNRQ